MEAEGWSRSVPLSSAYRSDANNWAFSLKCFLMLHSMRWTSKSVISEVLAWTISFSQCPNHIGNMILFTSNTKLKKLRVNTMKCVPLNRSAGERQSEGLSAGSLKTVTSDLEGIGFAINFEILSKITNPQQFMKCLQYCKTQF